ncbi:MbtH family protein [Polaromonas sp.]|uniref:MbtH family protein n=1 Tax=Polaromonas sp. TaxID=1869339 RepID=UPI002FCAF210
MGIAVSTIDDENRVFSVVVNDEGQHSIWPDFKPVPAGWQETDFKGLKKDCLEHIAKVWTDTRPLSLQRRKAP